MKPLTPEEIAELTASLCMIEGQPHYKPQAIEPNRNNAMYYRFTDQHRRHISLNTLKKILQERA